MKKCDHSLVFSHEQLSLIQIIMDCKMLASWVLQISSVKARSVSCREINILTKNITMGCVAGTNSLKLPFVFFCLVQR